MGNQMGQATITTVHAAMSKIVSFIVKQGAWAVQPQTRRLLGYAARRQTARAAIKESED
jgi:hypothetical protein